MTSPSAMPPPQSNPESESKTLGRSVDDRLVSFNKTNARLAVADAIGRAKPYGWGGVVGAALAIALGHSAPGLLPPGTFSPGVLASIGGALGAAVARPLTNYVLEPIFA